MAGAQEDLGSVRSSARETGPERACDSLIDTQLVKGFPEPEPRPLGLLVQCSSLCRLLGPWGLLFHW